MPARTAIAITALLATGLAGSALAQDGEPIKIGVVTPLTGTYAGIGEQVRWGLELAAKEINDNGGILGRQVTLLFEDEEANPSVAVRQAEKLFQAEGIDFLTGTVNSGSTLAVAQLAERNDRLASTTVSYSDAITGDQCSPNMFRVNASAHMQAATLAAWIAAETETPRVLYLGPDYEMGRSTVAAFRAAAEEKGAESVGELFAPLGTNDYSQYFGQLRSAQPEVIYTSVAGNDTVRLFTQLEEFGLRDQFTIVGAAGTVSGQNIGALGKSAENFVTGVGYSVQLDTPANQEFVKAFEEMHSTAPDLFGADSYGVLYFYKAAVEKAGSTETAAVREAMHDLEWETPQGTKTMRGGDHQALQNMYIVQVKEGDFTVIDQVAGEEVIGPDNCERF